MSMDGRLHLNAGDLYEALVVVVGAKVRRVPLKRPAIISLEYDEGQRQLIVSEARRGVRRHIVTANGVWPGRTQIDGRRLQFLIAKYSPIESVELMVAVNELVVVSGKSRIALPRTDFGRRAVEERPPKPDSRHRGKPYIAPDPVQKRLVWGDTWDFSARTPIPQHRKGQKED